MLRKQLLGRGALTVGALAAVLASGCCLGPLLLVMLGFSGAWIGNLTLLDPYRPIFIGVALVAMLIAYWRIYRPRHACESGNICAVAEVKKAYKILFWIVAALVLVALAYPYFLPLLY